ncbi:MarC family transcriptional regulator [Endozoicomonas sp. (ex Bugula neritina AB1)]|nr:MarC family transcriptional regulator [Endozoicomonas sp. (ex Bugula neritina AB1)]
MKSIIQDFFLIWAVVDPVGTVPVFLAVTSKFSARQSRAIAIRAVVVATLVLLFFILVGEPLLESLQIPLPAFQVAGGIVLFIFALTMIFGESKPDEELHMVRNGTHSAIFPLAIPSIASPGAMMAVVLMTKNHQFSVFEQVVTTTMLLLVMALTLALMLLAPFIQRLIGESGASVISRVMGLILASVATNSILMGLQDYFSLS